MRKPMSWLIVVLLSAVPLLGVLGATAYAIDLCLTFDSQTLVLKDVKPGKGGANPTNEINNEIKGPNRCKQLSGFFLGTNDFVNASLCTDSTGGHATVVANDLNQNTQTQFPLPIPSVGTTDTFIINPATSTTGVPTTAAVCVPTQVPVP